MARVIVFTKSGSQIAEFNACVTMAWKLNAYGKATWKMSTQDPKCKREYLEFGNRVMIEVDKLPAWVGVIDTPREWASHGEVMVTAYSAEYLLTWRRAPVDKKIQGTAGAKFEQLVKMADGLLIEPGEIFGGGKAANETLKSESIYEAILNIVERMGNDWCIVPNITPENELRFKANWYDKIGEARSTLLLDGYNIKATNKVMIEQGEIANDIIVVGFGASSGSQKTASMVDQDSIGLYDHRQSTVNLPSEFEGTLQVGAEQKIKELKQPRRTFDVNALDVGDTWSNLHIGDTYPLHLGNVGFSGVETIVRVVGMEYQETNGYVRLICDEVTE